MKIDRKLIAHLEELARIELSDEEVEKLTVQLDRIVAYIEQLQQVDTADIAPTRFVGAGRARGLRIDDPRFGLDREVVIKMAPDAERGFYRVPRIIGRGEE